MMNYLCAALYFLKGWVVFADRQDGFLVKILL